MTCPDLVIDPSNGISKLRTSPGTATIIESGRLARSDAPPPGMGMVAGMILWSSSFMVTGHEIISTAILSLSLIQVGQLSVTGERMVNRLRLSLPRKSVVRWTDSIDMTIAVQVLTGTLKPQQQCHSYRSQPAYWDRGTVWYVRCLQEGAVPEEGGLFSFLAHLFRRWAIEYKIAPSSVYHPVSNLNISKASWPILIKFNV